MESVFIFEAVTHKLKQKIDVSVIASNRGEALRFLENRHYMGIKFVKELLAFDTEQEYYLDESLKS